MGKVVNLFMALLLVLPLGQTAWAQEEATAASLYNDAVAKLKAKEYEAAFDLMGQALEVADPEADAQVIKLAKQNGAIAAYYLGTTQRKADDFESALATYEKGVEYNPAFYQNIVGKAQALEGLDNKAEAIKAYLEAGSKATAANKADKAESYVSKAGNIVAVTYGDKDYDQVVSLGNAYLEVAEDADVHYYISAALREQGNPSDALAHIEKAIEAGGSADDGKFLMTKGIILEDLNQPDAALEAYKQITSGKYADQAKGRVDALESGR